MESDDSVLVYFTKSTESSDDFPTKFGGKPVWLHPPTLANFLCRECKNSKLTFLGQIYCPLELQQAYHRVLYFFFCENQNCKNKKNSIVVYRMQMEEGSQIQPVLVETDCLTLEQQYFVITEIRSNDELKHVMRKVKKEILENLEDDDEQDEDQENPKEEVMEKIANDFGNEEPEQFQEKTKKVDDPIFQIYKEVMQKLEHPMVLYGNYPIYFRSGLDSSNKKKCLTCKGEAILELQINSCILHKFKRLLNFQWGVILVYTCKNSCKNREVQEQFDLQVEQQARMTKKELDQQLEKLKKDVKKKDKKKEKRNQKKEKERLLQAESKKEGSQQKQSNNKQQVKKQEEGGQWD